MQQNQLQKLMINKIRESIMTSIFPILFAAAFCTQCLAQKQSNQWIIKDIQTTYIQKSIKDLYELPVNLKGKKIEMQENLLIISTIRKEYVGSALSDEFGDTLFLEREQILKKQNDDELTILYPGDDLAECIFMNKDTCFVCETFFNLLGIKKNTVTVYFSSLGKHSQTKCMLFILEKNKKMALYSKNDFLLLFLAKRLQKKSDKIEKNPKKTDVKNINLTRKTFKDKEGNIIPCKHSNIDEGTQQKVETEIINTLTK